VITSRGGLSRPLKAARNRLNTETRIIQAVGAVLENDGFEKVGVNLVARTASVDKVLIYRYFGGLDGLSGAFGERTDIWWEVDEIVCPVRNKTRSLPGAP